MEGGPGTPGVLILALIDTPPRLSLTRSLLVLRGLTVRFTTRVELLHKTQFPPL